MSIPTKNDIYRMVNALNSKPSEMRAQFIESALNVREYYHMNKDLSKHVVSMSKETAEQLQKDFGFYTFDLVLGFKVEIMETIKFGAWLFF